MYKVDMKCSECKGDARKGVSKAMAPHKLLWQSRTINSSIVSNEV